MSDKDIGLDYKPDVPRSIQQMITLSDSRKSVRITPTYGDGAYRVVYTKDIVVLELVEGILNNACCSCLEDLSSVSNPEINVKNGNGFCE